MPLVPPPLAPLHKERLPGLQRFPMRAERRPGAGGGLGAPLAAVAAAAAAALGSNIQPLAAIYSNFYSNFPPMLPVHKAAKPSTPAAGAKRGKLPQRRNQLCRAVALLAIATLVAAAAAAGAVAWYAASILHERPEALAAAAADVHAAVSSAAAMPAGAPGHEGSDLLAGNYTVVIMSCEQAGLLRWLCESSGGLQVQANAAHHQVGSRLIGRMNCALTVQTSSGCPPPSHTSSTTWATAPRVRSCCDLLAALPACPTACLPACPPNPMFVWNLNAPSFVAMPAACLTSTQRILLPMQFPRCCWCGMATTCPPPRSSRRVRQCEYGRKPRWEAPLQVVGAS